MMKFRIGDRVKVIDQDITGTVIKYSNGNKLIILDDDGNTIDIEWFKHKKERDEVLRVNDKKL